MIMYPPQLTSEEKALKKRYARLQEKVRAETACNELREPRIACLGAVTLLVIGMDSWP